MTSASELLKLCDHHWKPVVSKLSLGVASLPDELLELIFKFATNPEQAAMKHAFCLSQVSRRFRRIALGDRSLWSTLSLHHGTKIENVKRCIQRSGKEIDLHISFNDTQSIYVSAMNAFMSACSLVAPRWRTLTISGNWDVKYIHFSISDILKDLQLHRRPLPRLHELCFIQHTYTYHTDHRTWVSSGNVFPGTSWAAPNLKVLRCTEYIPPASFPSSSITFFALTLTLIHGSIDRQIEEFLLFLFSMPNMAKIDLELINCDDTNDDLRRALQFTSFVCPGVTSFRLHVTNFSLASGTNEILAPFITALQMPPPRAPRTVHRMDPSPCFLDYLRRNPRLVAYTAPQSRLPSTSRVCYHRAPASEI